MWDSHCHLDYLGKNLAREGVQEGHRLEISLRLDGQELGNKFGGVVANFCNPQVEWWGESGGGDKGRFVKTGCITPTWLGLPLGSQDQYLAFN